MLDLFCFVCLSSLFFDFFPFSFYCSAQNSSMPLNIGSLDVPVVMPMTAQFPYGNPLPYPLTPLTATPSGMSYNLYNNLWNTNYIYYYPYLANVGDENSLFRFSLAW